MKYTAIALALLAFPASSETLLTEQQFDAFTSGTTVYFNRHNQPYGAEQYLKDRKVIWTFLNGDCERGAWFAHEDQICFAYETQDEPQCWHFLEVGGEKRGRVVGADPANDLTVVGQDTRDLVCRGPGVGVSYTPGSLVK